ncbi:hypothetical protein [Streptomyces scabiei]|uniref:hypothetical protein n=1 Tax=Streptomyces scabiei TaxID=1930 RepID=UPI001B33F87D|nr:hypothetical protein [Streptomyces sp. LBUM 1481]MBP5896437.1 hypothetical protein [Streptomyces sp. LBUM 1481]
MRSTDGNPYAVWRAFMDTTQAQPDPSMGFDYAANEVVFNEQDFQAKYKPTVSPVWPHRTHSTWASATPTRSRPRRSRP